MLSEVGIILFPISERFNKRLKSRGGHLSLSTHCQFTQSIMNEVILRLLGNNNDQRLKSFIRLYCAFCGDDHQTTIYQKLKILLGYTVPLVEKYHQITILYLKWKSFISASKCRPGLLSLFLKFKKLWSHSI